MTILKRSIASAFAAASVLALAACASEEADTGEEAVVTQKATASGTIIDIAAGDESFSTLVAAVTAAELAETLSGEGPFTVFAPTNDAFDKLPDGTVDTLTSEDTETLTTILTYHVVEGAVDAATLATAIEEAADDSYTMTTVGGGTVTASLVDGAVVLTDATGGTATVIATDVEASNGLIHVIDTVIMPG